LYFFIVRNQLKADCKVFLETENTHSQQITILYTIIIIIIIIIIIFIVVVVIIIIIILVKIPKSMSKGRQNRGKKGYLMQAHTQKQGQKLFAFLAFII